MDALLDAIFLQLAGSLIVALEGRGTLIYTEGYGTFEAYLPRPSGGSEPVTPVKTILDRHLYPLVPGAMIKTWVSSASTGERRIIEANLFPLDETYQLVVAYPVLNPLAKKIAPTPS